MYQPKIREDLIPRLYLLAKARKLPMTRLVAQLLEAALTQEEHEDIAVKEPPAGYRRGPAPRTKGGKKDENQE
jgi:hypothetical protein